VISWGSENVDVCVFVVRRASNAADPASVVRARRFETSFIAKWIKQYHLAAQP